MKKFIQLFIALIILVSNPVFAQNHHPTYHTTYSGSKEGKYHYSSSGHKVYEKKKSTISTHYKSSTTVKKTKTSHNKYSSGIKRDSHGKIKRSSSARNQFMKQTGYPHGRPGYVIDHIKPLKKGGCDCPSNMQWQTIKEGKAKDKWE